MITRNSVGARGQTGPPLPDRRLKNWEWSSLPLFLSGTLSTLDGEGIKEVWLNLFLIKPSAAVDKSRLCDASIHINPLVLRADRLGIVAGWRLLDSACMGLIIGGRKEGTVLLWGRWFFTKEKVQSIRLVPRGGFKGLLWTLRIHVRLEGDTEWVDMTTPQHIDIKDMLGGKYYPRNEYLNLLSNGSEERGLLRVGSINVAILPSCQYL